MGKRRIRVCALWLICVLHGARFATGSEILSTPDDSPPALLSAFRLFIDPALQAPGDGVVPYDLSTPLFGDYATKHRFVWIPPGVSATYHGREVFDFPLGTILIKTFGFLADMRDPAQGERLIETRLLVRKRSGWTALSYVWNNDGSDAGLAVAGVQVPVTWIHSDGSPRSVNYIIPNRNQCGHCHAVNAAIEPIGPKARYLNFEYEYSEGPENQLVRWSRIGYLAASPDPANAPKAPRWDDPRAGTLEDRARTYLDINCAHCHNPGGAAYTSGLDLGFDQTMPMRFGIMKSPVAAGRSAGVGRYDIEPGSPDTSILLHRLISTDPGMRMPTVGRNLMHEEGVALIRAWIEEMPANTCTKKES